MDFNTLDIHDSIKSLKCSLCSNYLSNFPIYITSNGENICGRCEVPKDVPCVRNEVYEILAEGTRFPCRYLDMGCVEKLHPGDLLIHENQCPLRKIKCPVGTVGLCNDEVSLPELRKHCESVHSDLVLANGNFHIDTSKSEETWNILIKDDDYFLFKKTFDSTTWKLGYFLLSIGYDPSMLSKPYKLSFKNGAKTITMSHQIGNVWDDYTNLDLSVLKLQESSVIESKLSVGGTDKKASSNELEEDLLKLLKCCMCSVYIKPPIKICFVDDKILCSHCGSFYRFTGKEYGFDKIASKLLYPCAYQPNGCQYSSKSTLLSQHEICCKYQTIKCPFKECEDNCKWIGLMNLVPAHINKNHYTLVASSSEFSIKICNLNGYYSFTKQYPIRFSKSFLRLVFYKSPQNNHYFWVVQTIGEVHDKLKYEIEVFNKAKPWERLVATQCCTPYVEAVDNITEYCYFQLDQFQHMLLGYLLTFKVRIFK